MKRSVAAVAMVRSCRAMWSACAWLTKDSGVFRVASRNRGVPASCSPFLRSSTLMGDAGYSASGRACTSSGPSRPGAGRAVERSSLMTAWQCHPTTRAPLPRASGEIHCASTPPPRRTHVHRRPRPMPQVADFIENNRDLLIRRFQEEAGKLESAQGLKPHQIIDTMPEYLATLATISRQGHRGDPEATKRRLEETHIGMRLRSGYNQEETTSEYVLLGRLISSLWEHLPQREQPPYPDKALLFSELQEAMNQVIVTFSGYTLEDRQREKLFLRRLEAIASGLFATPEVPVPLHERLGALVEVVQQAMNADAAALLLADPNAT